MFAHGQAKQICNSPEGGYIVFHSDFEVCPDSQAGKFCICRGKCSQVWRLFSQACYATGENHERAVLLQLLGELDLGGVLIQADALHTQKPFFGSSRSRGPTSC